MKPRKLDFSLAYDHLDCDSGPYVHRWIVETPWGSVRLHKWVGNDDQRAHHDHPWAFYTLILKGSYYDVTRHASTEWEQKMFEGRKSILKTELMKPGTLRFRPAKHEHTVMLKDRPCWSLVVTGPKIRDFGFRLDGKWLPARKWFRDKGKFPCS